MLYNSNLRQKPKYIITREFHTLPTMPLKYTLPKNATIHHVATMLATFKNVLFPGHNHLLTTSTDDPAL